MGEASCSEVQDALSARSVEEDVVFSFICEPDAIIELQEEFDAVDYMVKVLTSYTAFISRKFRPNLKVFVKEA